VRKVQPDREGKSLPVKGILFPPTQAKTVFL